MLKRRIWIIPIGASNHPLSVQGQDVMNDAGDFYPIGIVVQDYHNAEIVSQVMKIVIEEVFGYNTVWQFGNLTATVASDSPASMCNEKEAEC